MDDDRTLLQQYAATGAEAAFADLVDRHVDMVYAACLWRLRDPAAADDAAQATFVALAARAGSLSDRVVVAGWLYQTAVYQAAQAGRAAAIRRRHEMAAARQRGERDGSGPGPAGDAGEDVGRALGRLRPAERAAVVLRYLEGRSLAEVAAEMRTSEEAARKRVSRGLDRLRHLLLPPAGVGPGAMAASAAVVRLLAAGVGPAPAGLRAATLKAVAAHAAQVAGGSAAGAGLGLGGKFSTLKGVVLAMAKVKGGTAVAFGVAALVVAGGGGVLAVRSLRDRSEQVVHVGPAAATAAGKPSLISGGSGSMAMIARSKRPPLDGMVGPPDAPWRPAVDSAYRLNPGEVLRQVPGPPVPERQALNAELAARRLAGYASRAATPAGGTPTSGGSGPGLTIGQMATPQALAAARASIADESSTPPPPASRCLYAAGKDGRPAQIRSSDADDFRAGAFIPELIMGSAGLDATSLPTDLAMPGDWVVRDDASPKAVLDAAAAHLSKRLGREVRFEPRPGTRTSDVARGKFHYAPLPGFPNDGVVHLDDSPPTGLPGGPAGAVVQMPFLVLRSRLDPPMGGMAVDESAYSQTVKWAGFRPGLTVNDKLRGLVNRQTGLDWQVQTRATTRWTLVDANGRAVPPEEWLGK